MNAVNVDFLGSASSTFIMNWTSYNADPWSSTFMRVTLNWTSYSAYSAVNNYNFHFYFKVEMKVIIVYKQHHGRWGLDKRRPQGRVQILKEGTWSRKLCVCIQHSRGCMLSRKIFNQNASEDIKDDITTTKYELWSQTQAVSCLVVEVLDMIGLFKTVNCLVNIMYCLAEPDSHFNVVLLQTISTQAEVCYFRYCWWVRAQVIVFTLTLVLPVE